MNTSLTRREFMAAAAAAGTAPLSTLAFAAVPGDARLAVVVLRGALDGLAAVPPWGDPDYARLRGPLALAAPGTGSDAVLRLDGTFGLHPRLTFLHQSFTASELVVFHAVASPYRERSHFDGQSVLENGSPRPHGLSSGWLNRAIAALPPGAHTPPERGVAFGASVPLILRGPANVASWSGERLAALDDDILQRLGDLYAGDPVLSRRFADALAVQAMAGENPGAAQAMAGENPGAAHAMAGENPGAAQAMTRDTAVTAGPAPAIPDSAVQAAGDAQAPLPGSPPGLQRGAGGLGRYAQLIDTAARMLRRDDGPNVAVFDTSGWDTHLNEGGAQGQLAARLAALDSGLELLKQQLGPAWRRTAVLLITEFGRTAAANGTRGTDHGTATVALLLGGAVRGGRVVTDWPGLTARSLYQDRDLAPTLDLRSVLKGVLNEHLGLGERIMREQVFPGSESVAGIKGLMRS